MESMTGFGEGRAETTRLLISVSARSVNHRYLDTSLRLPEDFRRYEQEIRELVRARIARGRIDLRVESTALGEGSQRVNLRHDLLRSYRNAISTAVEADLLPGEPSAGEILRLPDVIEIVAGDSEDDEESTSAALRAAVEESLEALGSSRRSEGERLRLALKTILVALGQEIEELDHSRAELEGVLAQRLRARVEALLGDSDVDNDRLAMEIAILSEKGDVQEEIDRLRSHLEAFGELLQARGPVGKKMEFLCQEILRELNTVGSKCRETSAVDHVLEGKVSCEKLREQVQNIQ